MTSEGLGEMFAGDYADTCAGKFPLVSMGDDRTRQACAEGERGPPLAQAEMFTIFYKDLFDLFRLLLYKNIKPYNLSGVNHPKTQY